MHAVNPQTFSQKMLKEELLWFPSWLRFRSRKYFVPLLSEGAGSPTGKMALAYFHLLADYSEQVTLSMKRSQNKLELFRWTSVKTERQSHSLNANHCHSCHYFSFFTRLLSSHSTAKTNLGCYWNGLMSFWSKCWMGDWSGWMDTPHTVIQPAREARGPEGPARWER